MKKWIVLPLIVCLTMLPGCGSKVGQENGATFSVWENQLCSLVNAGQDEYLSVLKAEEAREVLSLRAVYPGSYTAPDVQELLCLFSVSGVPHIGGLERTILLLADQLGEKALGQTTLAGDGVEIILLEDTEGRSYPLFLGVGIQQGVHTYSMEMYEATAAGFIALPALEDLPQEGDLCYSFCADDLIQVSAALPSEFPGAPPEYQNIGVWQWDAAERCFRLRS